MPMPFRLKPVELVGRPTKVKLEMVGRVEKSAANAVFRSVAAFHETIRTTGDGSLLDDQELRIARPSVIAVEQVIERAGDDGVLQVHRTAEHFDAVIARVVDLHVIDRGG